MPNIEKLLNHLRGHLEAGEEVNHAVFGAYETKIMGNDSVRNGILVATNYRLLFYAKKLTGYDLEVFPYSTISSFEMGKNMMGSHVKFFASGNNVSVKWIRDKQLPEFVSYVKSLLGSKSSHEPTATDPLDQLRKLAELKKEGVITEGEFNQKKKKLLGL